MERGKCGALKRAIERRIVECDELVLYDYNTSWSAGEVPSPKDSVWGKSGSAGWDYLVGNGTNLLPQYRYVQARFTLTSAGGIGPSLDEIVVPRSITVNGVPTRDSKPVYVKTNVPAGTSITTKTGRLRVFWDASS